MEAALLELNGTGATSKSLESPVVLRRPAEVPNLEESEHSPLHLEVIPKPRKSPWRIFRNVLPVIVFLATVAGIIYLWPRF